MTPETVIPPVPVTGFTETSIIVIAICATIITLSLIFFIPKFRIKTDKDGMSFDIGAAKKPIKSIDNHDETSCDPTLS